MLFLVLLLREVLILKAPTVVPDVPPALLVLGDVYIPGPRERLLIERVRDHLAKRVPHIPVLQNLLDIEVKPLHAVTVAAIVAPLQGAC